MKIINTNNLSELLADKVKTHLEGMSIEDKFSAVFLYEEFENLKDEYEDMCYSQPNWTDNYSVAQMDKAKATYKEAEDLYLSKWDMPSAHMKALYSVPGKLNVENTEWYMCYLIEIKGTAVLFDIYVNKDGEWGYSLEAKKLTFEGGGELDIYDCYLKKLQLTMA